MAKTVDERVEEIVGIVGDLLVDSLAVATAQMKDEGKTPVEISEMRDRVAYGLLRKFEEEFDFCIDSW